MNKICFGCGIKLQHTEKEADGYIPSHKYEDSAYCQRCYQIIHYGKSDNHFEPKKFDAIINSINKDNKFVIFLTDFLNINENIVDLFKKIKAKKLFLISKADLIPRDVKDLTIKNLLKDVYQINNDIKFVSSINGYGVEALNNYLKRNNIKESYIVGLSNAGKSNLINKLIELNNSYVSKVTTSSTKNTTLDFIRLQIHPDLMLIDSPGFIMPSYEFIPSKIKSEIKPKVYQVKAGETLRIENFYLTFSDATSASIYIPNDFKVSKYYREIPIDAEIEISSNQDMIIYGLGFINIKNKCIIGVNSLDKSLIEIRESIFGENYE